LRALSIAQTATSNFQGKESDWHGFKSVEITVNDKPVTVVLPEKSARADKHPWVWHGEFFGHRPQPDIELLKRGFHIVYTRVPDMLGCPEAVAHWDKVYAALTSKHHFAPKVALGGEIELIAKSGIGHHPHGLEDSTPIVEFIERNVMKQFSQR